MTGGILQLVLTGIDTVYLTGDPSITMFKCVYRRHTNFSMESVRQTFDGQVDFGKSVTVKISRDGDLLGRILVEVDSKYFRPTEVDTLVGDYTKAKSVLGWSPEYTVEKLCEEMVTSDYFLFKNTSSLKPLSNTEFY